MQAYQQGDLEAFEELYIRYAALLTNLLRAGVANRQDGDELVQETFLHLHRARRDFRTGERLRPWLMTIALNLKRQYFRGRGRRKDFAPLQYEPEDQESGPSLEQKEQKALLHQALRKLDPLSRQVVELHWFAELPFSEVAQITGLGVSAAKVRAHRAYVRLRQYLPENKNEA